ncbi:hypothetical protein BaRGS_00005583 [Batillaria attramentaria]|uniref:Uncharacterized protein n=1 Tax=Batillaria attramentaria TaxID=370345 RepID=A0ABD0LVA8_9CAEN
MPLDLYIKRARGPKTSGNIVTNKTRRQQAPGGKNNAAAATTSHHNNTTSPPPTNPTTQTCRTAGSVGLADWPLDNRPNVKYVCKDGATMPTAMLWGPRVMNAHTTRKLYEAKVVSRHSQISTKVKSNNRKQRHTKRHAEFMKYQIRCY